MEELKAGGISNGKKRGMHNTRISIEKTLKTGALRKVGDLIGLPEWSDEKFANIVPEAKKIAPSPSDVLEK